jgi:hypothetical protein
MERILIMSEAVIRKIKLKEVLLISKILRGMGTKNYAEYAMRQLEKNKKQLDLIKKDKSKTEDEIKKAKEDFDNSLGIDVGIFVLENIELAKEAVYELIASYNEIPTKEAENLDFDIVIDTFKNMFKAGLPEVLFTQLKKVGGDFLTKSNVLNN